MRLLHPVPLVLQPREGRVRVGIKWRDGHQPHQLQAVRVRYGGAEFVDRVGTADVHPAPRLVAVRLSWRYTRKGAVRRRWSSASVHARASAAISRALSTECAAYAQPAIDRALLR